MVMDYKRRVRLSWRTVVMDSMSVGCVVVCCLLSLSNLASNVEAKTSAPCHTDFSVTSHIELCHDVTASHRKATYSCSDDAKGFILSKMVIAPSSYHKDCGMFNKDHLYDARCLANETHQQDEYDRIIFDIMDRISGKSEIQTSTVVVDRFPVTVVTDSGVQVPDSSAFVSFRNLCKPADPDLTDNMINLCSNRTFNSTFVYFTLQGTADIPHTPSMCRCVLRPTVKLQLLALDIRLQNASNRQCGPSALRIETNESRKDVDCNKLSALYGSDVLYTSDSPQEVTLTLTYISPDLVPTSIWIDAQDVYDGKLMSVTCEGFLPLPQTTIPPDDGGDDDDKGTDNGDDGGGDNGGEDGTTNQPRIDSAGVDLVVIIGSLLGALFVIAIIVIAFIVIKRRRGGALPACCACCNKDDDDPVFYKVVAQQEPIYAEPGKPRPSTTTPPYTFPADARFVDDGKAVYAEPDPNGTLGLAVRATTPPPVPDSPPPVPDPNPVPVFSPCGTPPPKPERTLLRPNKKSVSDAAEEEYDHIVGGKTPLKSPRGRDGQNNIIGGRGADGGQGNVYDCLRHNKDYSDVGERHNGNISDRV